MANLSKVCEQFERVGKMCSIFLLFLNGQQVGRIIARATKTVMHVAVDITAVGGCPIYGYARMTGGGYDRINSGIAEILAEHRDILSEAYGITISDEEWEIMNDWRSNFKNAGWEIIQAL